MDFTLSSIKKDLLRWMQDPTGILLWIVLPLMIGGMTAMLFGGGGGVKPHGVLLIADQDDSLISGLVAGAFSQGELGELISVEKVSVDAGTEKINNGEASGFLIIPSGFGAAFFESTPVTLTLRTNPAQTILPGIIADVTEIFLDAGFYAEQLFGAEIRAVRTADKKGAVDEVLVSSVAVAVQQKIDSAATRIFPPALDVVIVEPPPSEPAVPLGFLFLPGVILMGMMFAANGLAGDYWTERELGALRRIVFAPSRLMPFLVGKALAAGLVIATIGGLTLFVGFLYLGIAWHKLPASLLWVAVSGIALFAWFGALQMSSSSRRAGNLVTSMLLFPLLMIGGSFFPLASLPNWMAAFGRRTPNGFIADQLSSQITTAGAWSIGAQNWLIVLAIAASGLLVCAWRLQSGFARS